MSKLYSLPLLVIVILLTNVGTQELRANPSVTTVITVARLVLQGAKDLGLDKAGEHYLGSQWAAFKTVLGPLFGAFPSIMSNGDDRRVGAQQAIQALESDPRFRELIQEQLAGTGSALTNLWIRVDVLETFVLDHERRLAALETGKRTGTPVAVPSAPPESARSSAIKQVINRLIGETGPRAFSGIRGQCLRRGLQECEQFESMVIVPGARTCSVTVARADKPTTARCDFFEPKLWFPKPDPARPNAPTVKTDTPSREVALLTFVEVVQQIDQALPPHWRRRFPEEWSWMQKPEHWPFFVESVTRDARRRVGTRKVSREELASLEADGESAAYTATEPGNGRSALVHYSVTPPFLGSEAMREVIVEFR
jgi:hypothetical protein